MAIGFVGVAVFVFVNIIFVNIMQNTKCKMHNAQFTMHNAKCIMQNAQCTMCNAQCTMCNAQCSMHNAQYTMHNSKCTNESCNIWLHQQGRGAKPKVSGAVGPNQRLYTSCTFCPFCPQPHSISSISD